MTSVHRGLLAGLAIAAFQICLPQVPWAQQPSQTGTFTNGLEEIRVNDLLLRVDPRVQQRTYLFQETNERLPYAVFVSSKVSKAKKAPLIVALHGRGQNQSALMLDAFRTVELAEQGGYVVVAPMGYNASGWYGIPQSTGARGNRGGAGGGATPFADRGGKVVTDTAKVRELSAQDVLHVLAIAKAEFNIDERRTYLLGHSMGGAGTLYLGVQHAPTWAAIAALAPAVPPTVTADMLAGLTHVPVFLAQGDADTSVPVAETRQLAATLKDLKVATEYHEIPGADHGTVVSAAMSDAFAFFDRHRK